MIKVKPASQRRLKVNDMGVDAVSERIYIIEQIPQRVFAEEHWIYGRHNAVLTARLAQTLWNVSQLRSVIGSVIAAATTNAIAPHRRGVRAGQWSRRAMTITTVAMGARPMIASTLVRIASHSRHLRD